ncbi:hypothetical protein V7152_05890 [Neobacillus drentensis]|uniref:hypothetical protein n=1 Tax=Neobacillus drentensis TaxID=220684 RepID=UPI002FFEB602
MKITKLALLLSTILLITGCSKKINNSDDHTNKDTNSSGSYKALLFVNGKELQTVGETAGELGLVLEEIIGTVKDKIDIEIRPIVELTSNY